MTQIEIWSALGLYILVCMGTFMTGGNTILIVFSFYVLILSLIGTNWKSTEKKQDLNVGWLITTKSLAVLNLVFFGGLFVSLLGIFPKGYFQMANLKLPMLVSVLVLLGDLENDKNLRKSLIFFIWFDLVRWMIVFLGSKIWKEKIRISKIKLKIQSVE